MHSASLTQATRHFLTTFWSLKPGCAVRVTNAPGRPLGCMESWAITIWDDDQSFEGKIGYYPRFGCMVTLSVRLDGISPTDLESFLDQPRVGFKAVRDALAAFLHKYRWQILEWANILVDAVPGIGPVNNLVEAPRPLRMSTPRQQNPTWWGQTTGQLRTRSGNTEEAQAIGYSADIAYGQSLAMLTDTPGDL